MDLVVKRNSTVTITDITESANEILKSAKNAFTSSEYKKMAYLRKRKWYWMDNGLNELEAELNAKEDYEWSF